VTEFRALLAAADLRDPTAAAIYLTEHGHKVITAEVVDWRTGRARVPAWAIMALRVRVADLVGPPHVHQPTDNRPEPQRPPARPAGVPDRRDRQ
jgi:hypothetical protein